MRSKADRKPVSHTKLKWIMEKKTKRTGNKSNASFEAVQYRQDVFPIANYHNRKKL